MSEADHVSIGDVLNQLREEFPDVTISKIRFLESQGLIDPERTASGYRRFGADDVERLRWILRQQKEHFLPLKVIKEQIDEMDSSGGFAAGPRAVDSSAATALQTALDEEGAEGQEIATGGVSLTRAELARAADLSDGEIAELEEYGLVKPSFAGRDRALFDEHALVVARLAAGFRQYGIEPRHLRMYRAFAEREAALFEQVLLRHRRQRNPDAASRADAAWRDLARLGRQLRRALLEQRH